MAPPVGGRLPHDDRSAIASVIGYNEIGRDAGGNRMLFIPLRIQRK